MKVAISTDRHAKFDSVRAGSYTVSSFCINSRCTQQQDENVDGFDINHLLAGKNSFESITLQAENKVPTRCASDVVGRKNI